MMDFAQARRRMVDSQVRTADVTNLAIIDAMLAVPRERFVATAHGELAYLDSDAPIDPSAGRYLLKPMVLAKLVQAAEIKSTDRVLDVGCATGYAAALLAQLAGEVIALEDSADLAAEAKKALAGTTVEVVTGRLAAGWPARAPYDVILIEGAVQEVPAELSRQLAEGGRLVCVLRDGPQGKAMLYCAFRGEVSGRAIFDANAKLLPGFTKEPSFVF